MTYQSNQACDFYGRQLQEIPGIGSSNLRPILCRECHGGYHHIRNGTTCAACNNSFIELLSDVDYRQLGESHGSNVALNSKHSDSKKHDKKGGKKDQSSSRTSRSTRH